MTKTAYIFFGKSGSGKGTQAKLLLDILAQKGQSTLHIETGAELRAFVASGSYIANLTGVKMAEGSLMPDFLAVATWTQKLIKEFDGTQDLVLDGLARRAHEAPSLHDALEFLGFEKIYVIHIKTSDEWCTERLLGRGRSDDNIENIKNRLNWFEQNTMPSVNYFAGQPNYNFIEVDGEQTIEQVHAAIMQKLV